MQNLFAPPHTHSKKILLLFILFVSLSFVSASITGDLFSDNVTSMDITISPSQSQVDFYFNSEGYDWDEFNVSYEDLTIKNLYLSDLLNSFSFKIENNDNPQFTEIHIDEGSTLQVVVDNVLTYMDYSFYVENINQNISLINDFIELDNSEAYQSFEKSGNHFIYNLDSGADDVDISEVVGVAVQEFDISEILDEVGIENIYDLSFTMELPGIEDVPLENGQYELNLHVVDGSETYDKTITLTLEGFEEDIGPNPVATHNKIYKKDDAPEPKEITVSPFQLDNGAGYSLKNGDFLSFNIGGDSHSLKIEFIGDNSVFFTLKSDPVTFELQIGKNQSTCLSDSESVTISLSNIIDDEAQIKIQKQVDTSCKEFNATGNEEETGNSGITGAATGGIGQTTKIVIYGLILLIIIALILVFVGTKRKKRHSK